MRKLCADSVVNTCTKQKKDYVSEQFGEQKKFWKNRTNFVKKKQAKKHRVFPRLQMLRFPFFFR